MALKHGVAYTNLCPEPRCGESFMDHSKVSMCFFDFHNCFYFDENILFWNFSRRAAMFSFFVLKYKILILPRCCMCAHQAALHHSRVHMVPTNPPPSWSGLRMQTCVDCGAGYTFLHQLQRHRARASHPLQLLTTFMNDALIPVLPGVAVGFHSDL